MLPEVAGQVSATGGDGRIASDELQRYWALASQHADVVSFLRACHQRIGVFDLGPLLGAVISAPSIRVALEVMERYLCLVSDLLTLDTIADDNVMLLRLRNAEPLSWQNQWLFLFVFLDAFSRLTRRPATLHSVLLNHPDPGCGRALEDSLQAPVLFDSGFTSLVMEPQDVDALLGHRCDDIHAALVRLLEQELMTRYSSLWLRARDTVRQLLVDGVPVSGDAVAGQLNLSRRSLQRKLAAQGASLSEIYDEVRVQEATRLLITTQRPIDWIAHRTGFHNQSSFAKFFSRTVGVSPRAYRRSQGV